MNTFFAFIDRHWTGKAALLLLALIVIAGALSGVNSDIPGHSFHGFFDKSAYLIREGNVAAVACVGLSATLVFLVLQGWVRSYLKDRRVASMHLWPLLAMLGELAFWIVGALVLVRLAVWLYRRFRARAGGPTEGQSELLHTT